jgi:hypothetical protein
MGISMGICEFLRISMEFLRDFYGISVDFTGFLWDFSGNSMGFRDLMGFWLDMFVMLDGKVLRVMEFLWYFFGIGGIWLMDTTGFMEFVWHSDGFCGGIVVV